MGDKTVEADAVKALRKLYPKMRREQSTAIVHSGSRRRVFGCVCGATESCCADYPVTARVWAWRQEHAACAAKPLLSGTRPVYGEER